VRARARRDQGQMPPHVRRRGTRGRSNTPSHAAQARAGLSAGRSAPRTQSKFAAFDELCKRLIIESNSPKGYFFLELLPNRSELSPVHGRLLPLCFNPSSSAEGTARPVLIGARRGNNYCEPPAVAGRGGYLPNHPRSSPADRLLKTAD